MRVAAVGGLNLDMLGVPDTVLRLRDSNPGQVILRAGGVAHNIARQLARRGHEAVLCAALGRDTAAQTLKNLCADEGIDLSACVESGAPTCVYLCLHEDSGDMLCAVNDMRAMESVTPEEIERRLPLLLNADLCVVDANLRADTLLFCARRFSEKMPVFLDPVSTFKSERVKPALPYLCAVKPNRMEAEAMTGEREPARAAEQLLRTGVSRVFISLGAEGVYYADQSSRGLCPASPLAGPVPLTGAGDALCAGLIEGIFQNLPAERCAQLGNLSAHEALTQAMESEEKEK